MADTVTLAYSEAGQGTPVVLLHGFPLNGAIWHEQQKQLSDRFRVITPDLRGHGRSPAPSGIYEMDLLARDVLALLDALLIKKAIIIGHSMGGYVALAAWKLAPDRFLALGLIDSHGLAAYHPLRQLLLSYPAHPQRLADSHGPSPAVLERPLHARHGVAPAYANRGVQRRRLDRKNGQQLNHLHGAPLRLRAENQLGFKMVKWIQAIEFVENVQSINQGEGGYAEDHEYFGELANI